MTVAYFMTAEHYMYTSAVLKPMACDKHKQMDNGNIGNPIAAILGLAQTTVITVFLYSNT